MDSRRASFSLLLCIVMAGCGGTPPGPAASPPPAVAPSTDPQNAPLPAPLPDIAARVNGQPILTRRVGFVVKDQVAQKHVSVPQKPAAYRRVLDSMIDRELAFQEAEARGIKPDDRVVDQAYNEARIGYKDDKGWAGYLDDMGMDDAVFRAELRVKFTVERLFGQEVAKLPATVSDEDAEAFFKDNPKVASTGERLRVAQILIRADPDMAGAVRSQHRFRADRLLSRIRAGEDFAKLAKENSGDAESAKKGGELPVFSHGQVPPAIDEAVSALGVGGVSPVVQTTQGFHIIKLLEKLPPQTLTYADVRDGIKAHLLEARRQEALGKLVASLRAKAKIEKFL